MGEATKSPLLRVLAVKVTRQSAGSPKPPIFIEKELSNVLKLLMVIQKKWSKSLISKYVYKMALHIGQAMT